MHQLNHPRQRPRIVIVGAGFGGFQAAVSLAGADAEVLLVDRHNYHTFIPLIYQVATAQLEPSLVSYPVRTLLRGRNVRFLQAQVERVDFHHKLVATEHGPISYDYLVLATGTQASYHGVSGAREHAFTLKTLGDAIALRQHILSRFELALTAADEGHRRQLLSFVIVGGGPTGVELAGALAELLRGPFRRDFPELAHQWRLVLVQSGSGLLQAFPQRLGNYAHRQLERLGVDVRLNRRVQQISPSGVELPEETIATETVIWAAGTQATHPDLLQPVEDTRKGKLQVQDTLQLSRWPNVYAIGDLAYFEQNGQPLSGVAPEALQQGVTVARNLRRQLQKQPPQPFRYLNKGRLAIVGGYGGVGKIAGVPFGGFLAWLMWLGVHLVYLPGYRNRLLVLLSWMQNYLLRDRAVRQVFPQSQR